MKCSKCGLNEATAQVRISRGGSVQTLYLCRDCAKEYESQAIDDSFGMLSKLINGSPMGVLSGFNGLFDVPQARALICPECKTTSEEFLKTGFVGCPNCYRVFEPLIVRTVRRLQQSDRHVGKTPNGAEDSAEQETRQKKQLQAAVDSNDYAAISALSEQLRKLVGNKREDKNE